MLVKCKYTQGDFRPLILPWNLRLQIGEENYCSSCEPYTIDAGKLVYRLSSEKIYTVYGLLIANGELRYLVEDDDRIPRLFPEALFEVISHCVPDDWENHYYTGPSATIFQIFPPELCLYADLIGIMREEPHIIQKFIKLREWYSKWDYERLIVSTGDG